MLAASAAFDLRHEVCWQAQGLYGLVQSLCSPLRLTPVALQAFMRLSATALSGFGVFFGVSFAGGPRGLLPTVMLARHGEKDTMSPQQLDFKNFHGSRSSSSSAVATCSQVPSMYSAVFRPAYMVLPTRRNSRVFKKPAPLILAASKWQNSSARV